MHDLMRAAWLNPANDSMRRATYCQGELRVQVAGWCAVVVTTVGAVRPGRKRKAGSVCFAGICMSCPG